MITKAREGETIGEDLGCKLAQLAIAWCLVNPNVSTVILGASRIEQLEENLDALEVVEKLTPEVMERIGVLLGNAPEGPERI